MPYERAPYVLAALVAALVPTTPAAGQAIGAGYVLVESDHVELPDPSGLALHARIPLGGPSWQAQLEYYTVSDDTRKQGTVCVTYSPRIGCDPAETTTSMTLSGFRAAALRSFGISSVFRLEAGGGLSFNHVDGDAEGPNGERADLLVPNGGQIGVLAFVSASVTPVPSVPLSLFGGFDGHWIDFNGCSDEERPQYAPFCTSEVFREIQVGVRVNFR